MSSASNRLRRKADIQLSLAATDLLRRLRDVQDALDARDAAVAEWIRRSKCTTRQAGQKVRDTLIAAGFTDEEIRLLGVSDGNVRLISRRVP